jgi:hypothetical protein
MKKVEETKIASATQPIKPRRKFDSAFKRDAVALWLSSSKSAREIGAELGITERHLGEHEPIFYRAFGEQLCLSAQKDGRQLVALGALVGVGCLKRNLVER